MNINLYVFASCDCKAYAIWHSLSTTCFYQNTHQKVIASDYCAYH